MPLLSISSITAPSYYYQYQKLNHRISASLVALVGAKRAMVTASSSSKGAGAFTTIKERVSFEKEIKKSKFIAIAGPISDEQSAFSFLSQVRDPRATHNCWAYKVGDQYRSNDDGEPSGTAGKPIHSAILSSGIDRVMVVVIRYFGGIKLGTGGLVRAYGGVTSECLRNAPTCVVKSKVPMGVEVPFDLLGILYHQTSNRIMILVKMASAWSLSKLILTGLRSWRRLSKPIVAEIWCFINTERLGHVLYVGVDIVNIIEPVIKAALSGAGMFNPFSPALLQ